MADHVVVHWLYTTISPELLDAVMQPDDTALIVWAAVDGIFRDNQLAHPIYLDAEYHAVVQGDMMVMAYCTKLKQFTDQLRDLRQTVTEPQQVFNLLRGLNRQYHSTIPHITSQVPLPLFLQVRSFLLLEEHRAEQSARQQSVQALVVGRGSSSTPPGTHTPAKQHQPGARASASPWPRQRWRRASFAFGSSSFDVPRAGAWCQLMDWPGSGLADGLARARRWRAQPMPWHATPVGHVRGPVANSAFVVQLRRPSSWLWCRPSWIQQPRSELVDHSPPGLGHGLAAGYPPQRHG
jgi:hypothetical protein